MKFASWIKRLEKRGIISRKPHPAIPFILSFIILILGIVILSLAQDKAWTSVVVLLACFSFLFAILHWVVVLVLRGKSKEI